MHLPRAHPLQIVIPNKLVGDEVQMDLAVLTAKLAECGPENVLAIVTTTSIFAPRAPDDVVGVAKLCKEHGVPHVVNNAYGIQASKYTHLLNEAIRVGRLDVFIQSTDKNLLVPVGGAIAVGGRAIYLLHWSFGAAGGGGGALWHRVRRGE